MDPFPWKDSAMERQAVSYTHLDVYKRQQKMFSCMKGTSVLDTLGEEKKTQMETTMFV